MAGSGIKIVKESLAHGTHGIHGKIEGEKGPRRRTGIMRQEELGARESREWARMTERGKLLF